MTAGGDDNDILNLAWYCIFEIARSKTCDQPIANSTAILRSKEWNPALKTVIAKAKQKGTIAAGPSFVLFVIGYTQFPNENTPQCNNVAFSYWNRTDPTKLTKDLRKRFSNLTMEINQKIEDTEEQHNIRGYEQVRCIKYGARFEGRRPPPPTPKISSPLPATARMRTSRVPSRVEYRCSTPPVSALMLSRTKSSKRFRNGRPSTRQVLQAARPRFKSPLLQLYRPSVPRRSRVTIPSPRATTGMRTSDSKKRLGTRSVISMKEIRSRPLCRF